MAHRKVRCTECSKRRKISKTCKDKPFMGRIEEDRATKMRICHDYNSKSKKRDNRNRRVKKNATL